MKLWEQTIFKTKYEPAMDDSSYRRNFDPDKKNETITIAGKSILKWVKLQSLVGNCCKTRKI
jgi:hypothetical protein